MEFIKSLLQIIVSLFKKETPKKTELSIVKDQEPKKEQEEVIPFVLKHAQSIDTSELFAEYENAYKNLKIDKNNMLIINRAVLNKKRYETVARAVHCPWFLVAVIHYRESTFDFKSCLHNGDLLPGPTINVPKGRGPFQSWEDAAVDALKINGVLNVKTWDLNHVFCFLEKYNGWGYRLYSGKNTTPKNSSPYIYSATPYYEKGKYKHDGNFDPNLIDQQIGAMAFIKTLYNLNQLI